ncbi:MAG TPA: alpha/beta hydrolase [Puia sp.]|nr:alpha/beta hydrolase [Puia sp.]
MKWVIRMFFFFGVFFSASAQQKIEYGNNKTAGSYITIRGIKMYYEIYGQGEPLLLIHGNGGSINAFAANIPFFSKKYKVIALDSRAQGKTIDDNDSLSFEMMADDEAALLDALHIDSAYVIGWSDGGINALLLALRHPGKVKKLVSTGANLWPDSTAIIPAVWNDDKNTFDTTHTERFNKKQRNDWKMFLLDWFQPNISLQQLHSIKCPALIIGGDHDLIRVEHTVLIAQNIPKSYLWIVPNSGHATLIEHRDEFNKKADDFFSDLFNQRK